MAFRYLAADQHPDHDTIADFRKEPLANLSPLFVQVWRLCPQAGLVKLGHVALDGTKVKANASKHKAMSYARRGEAEKRLEEEVPCGAGPPPGEAGVADQMRHKLQTVEGQAVYKLRKAVVEPVFGQIKEQRGFRRFLLRGRAQVEAEWKMICATHNLLKLFRSGWSPQSA